MPQQIQSPGAVAPSGTTANGQDDQVQAGLDVIDDVQQTEGDQGEGQTGDEGEPQGEPAAEPKSSGLSKEDVTDILTQVMAKAPQQQQAPQQPVQQPQLTQAELEDKFGFWKPDEAFVARLLAADNPKAVVAALVDMRNALQKQHASVTSFYLNEQMKRLQDHYEQQLAPLRDFVTEQQAARFRDEFFKQNEDLTPYEQIADMVAVKAEQNGTLEGKSRDERMKFFAAETRKIVKQLLAQKGQNGADGTIQTPAKKQSKMSTLTGGGQTGGTKSGGSKKYDGLQDEVAAGLTALD